MGNSSRDHILRKLKALYKHSESARAMGSEAEAQSFAEMMQRLAAQHQVDASELEEKDQEELNPLVEVRPNYGPSGLKARRRHIPWLQELAAVVARGHYCEYLIVPGSSVVYFAGRKLQAESAARTYESLAMTAESLADKEYVRYFYKCRDEGDVTKARGYRESFLVGFCSRLGKRYSEFLNATREYFSHDARALAVLDGSRSAIADWLKNRGIKDAAPRSSSRVQNIVGYKHGATKADEVEFTSHQKID